MVDDETVVYRAFLKRCLDVIAALSASIVLLPLFLVLAALVRIRLGGPVLFTQTRPGRGGVPFRMIKFRSMTGERDADGELLPDADRLPPFGRFLRATSLDELPEMWNVLAGHMSIVGPRPLLMEYLALYTSEQRRRHDVRPGITGWAQVNGRNAISWDHKFELDVWYVDNYSFALDVKIVALTLWRVVRRDGISPVGEAVMPRFTGLKDIDIK